MKTITLFQKRLIKVAAGEVIFRQGEHGEEMYGLLSGEVELKVNDQVKETIQAGDVFGEGAIVQPKHTRASTAIAKTDCEIATLDRERFLFAIQETPLFALEVIKSLSDRLRIFKNSLNTDNK
ncbi:MAG: cyclic nucleotide-binding domain-containing protein [Microcoleaceae cyanobacterium]